MTKVRLHKLGIKVDSGKSRLDPGHTQGFMAGPPVVGEPVTLWAVDGDAGKRYLRTSPIQTILGEKGHFTYFETRNSIYKLERLN